VFVTSMPRRLVLAALAAALVPAAGASSAADAAEPNTGRLLVTLAAPAGAPSAQAGGADSTRRTGAARTARAARALTAVPGARPGGRVVPELGLVTVRPQAGESLDALRRRLARRADVADVRPERRFSLRYVPNDPALVSPEAAPGTPPGVPVQWWAERQGLFGRGTSSAARGADRRHRHRAWTRPIPDLADRIDLAADRDATLDAGPATVDESGHGTHVASLACGGGDNGIGLAGAGLNCRLLSSSPT
jgi:hypothetical protein